MQQQNASPLMQAYRLAIVVISFVAAVSFGIGMHLASGAGTGTGAGNGFTFGCVGIVLGMIAQGMSVPLRNPPFNCLLVVGALVIIALVALI